MFHDTLKNEPFYTNLRGGYGVDKIAPKAFLKANTLTNHNVK